MGESILILDDEPPILDLLDQFLGAEGYECVQASTAAEAFTKIADRSFALLLTDLGLPDMNGLDVVRKVRDQDAEMGVIVVTGLKDVNSAVEALRAGADDYLTKPFNLREISIAVSKVLEKRALVIANRRHQQELEERVREATAGLELVNQELNKTKEYLENLLHSTVDAILTSDREGKIAFVNEGALDMLGYSRDEFLRLRAFELFARGEDEIGYLRRAVGDGKPLQHYETEFKHKDGHTIPINMSLSQVHEPGGEVVSWLAICKDITHQKQLERELKELSIKDSLTGLFNQRHFYDRIEAEIERARRQSHALSLLLIDLDQFKWYNDTNGHLAGDAVLRAVGEVIDECTRVHVDLAFRYGGDEFTVILPEADETQARVVAERIRTTFNKRGFERVSMSIGVMQHRPGCSIRTFTQSADAMMYEAKRAGGNQIRLYDPLVCARALRENAVAAVSANTEE